MDFGKNIACFDNYHHKREPDLDDRRTIILYAVASYPFVSIDRDNNSNNGNAEIVKDCLLILFSLKGVLLVIRLSSK